MSWIKELFQYLSNTFRFWIMVMPWEQGLRVRLGKKQKVLMAGLHFRIPFFDSIYRQSTRLRILHTPLQTVSTKDNVTITVIVNVGIIIIDIQTLYNKVFELESTLTGLVLAEIAKRVRKIPLAECTPDYLEKDLFSEDMFGCHFEHVRITNFAVVKTYRLIQDANWMSRNIPMDTKH